MGRMKVVFDNGRRENDLIFGWGHQGPSTHMKILQIDVSLGVETAQGQEDEG